MNRHFQHRHFQQWSRLAPAGLALIGFGLSVAMDAATRKGRGGTFGAWFWQGTLGLILVNTGVALFGEAVKQRTLYELKQETPTSLLSGS